MGILLVQGFSNFLRFYEDSGHPFCCPPLSRVAFPVRISSGAACLNFKKAASADGRSWNGPTWGAASVLGTAPSDSQKTLLLFGLGFLKRKKMNLAHRKRVWSTSWVLFWCNIELIKMYIIILLVNVGHLFRILLYILHSIETSFMAPLSMFQPSPCQSSASFWSLGSCAKNLTQPKLLMFPVSTSMKFFEVWQCQIPCLSLSLQQYVLN